MQTVKLAIQKSGRLNEKSYQLLRECGIHLENGGRALKAKAINFPMEVLFLRDDDIPQYVAEGIADLGILGRDVVAEKDKGVNELLALGFSRCRLSLAIPREIHYPGLSYFRGKRIATSYPNTLGKFLRENKISAQVEEISGSVEIAPGIGLAEGICDIVSTGSTLMMNGLKEVETVVKSEAILISSPGLSDEKMSLADRLIFRIKSVLSAHRYKYILLNSPDEKIQSISEILPGMKSPTVIPLAQKGWSSLHSVISENDFWEVIDQLKERGAEGILIAPIEKMVL